MVMQDGEDNEEVGPQMAGHWFDGHAIWSIIVTS